MVAVLILAKITSTTAGGYATYLNGKTQAAELGDYYLKDGERTETPGRWVGGAERFGIDPSEAVSEQQLHALMDVRRPDSGESLRRVGGTGAAVSAIDATFSAPKSVSSAWALAGPELRLRIEQAHEAAIDRAVTYAVQQVPMLRRRVAADHVVHEKAAGVIATSWRHTTARAVDEQVPDPQLHSHLLLHAAVRKDGEAVAIDSRSWLVHQPEVGAAYRTELARELADLGFAIQRGTGRGNRYFELDGIPQPLIDRWSSRHHQVTVAIRQRLERHDRELADKILEGGPAAVDAARQRETLRETGQLSPKQDRLMGAVTRGTKTPNTVDELDTAWQRTALPLGASRERIEVLRRSPSPTLAPATADQLLEGLTEFDATFPARDARAVALERSTGMPIGRGLEKLRELRDRDEILVLSDGSATTADHRGREHAIVAITQRLTDSHVKPIGSQHAQREADRLDHDLAQRGGRLSDEQRRAITIACGDRPLTVIEGQAGTGKSTALIGIARAHQSADRQIIVTSTAALAAERLAGELADNDVPVQAYSTVGLDNAIRTGRVRVGPQTTIIHDEAALASTREQLNLLYTVERSGGRLIEVGDPQQSQPVGAGGLWHHIEDTARDAGVHVELTVNQRALDPADRRDQKRFRDGKAELAIRGYAVRDRIHLHPDAARAEDDALENAHIDRANGMSTIVIAQTSNDHLDQLNARAQAIRTQRRELGDESLPVPGRPYSIHPGDQVQIRHGITDRDHQEIHNGTTATVQTINPNLETTTLELSDGRNTELDAQKINDADLRLAYVQHPFPAQGTTTDTAHLIVTDHTTQEGSYVAITRAREQADIYSADTPSIDPNGKSDRLTTLAETMNRTEPDIPSIATPLRDPRRREVTNHEPLQRDAPDPSTPQQQTDRTMNDAAKPARRRWRHDDDPNAIETERTKTRYVGFEP